ncbi:MAG: hypothetical protein N3F03_04460 [Ignavibacteria bacterium]|nr:hypothetical protein [Ignavibacteria bacterium]
MIRKEKFLPALVTGFSLAVISIVPILQVATCCLFAPLAGMFGLNMYYIQMKSKEGFKLQNSDGFQIGFLIGIISGFFESIFQSLLILVSKDNPVYDSIILLQRYLPNTPIPDALWNISNEIEDKRFSAALSLMIFFNATLINSIFAIIGSLLSISTIKKKMTRDTNF